jgi:hypothetical protein
MLHFQHTMEDNYSTRGSVEHIGFFFHNSAIRRNLTNSSDRQYLSFVLNDCTEASHESEWTNSKEHWSTYLLNSLLEV